MRVVAAMSGGVDSSVAAAMLSEQGHDVIGLSMQLYDQQSGQTSFGSCCSIDDLHDARRVATKLGIPHYILNFEREFNAHVVSGFVQDYASARTPIPCVHCNGKLKFTNLLDRALGLGATTVATGHYARVESDGRGHRVLRRGLDLDKDQSYFLFTLTQDQLAHAQFPLGELSKLEVRAYAAAQQLPVADKPDSHEICFVPDGDYAGFVERHVPEAAAPGPIADTTGRVVGKHAGIHRFTVGQRKGLGLSSPVPLYVVSIDAGSRTVTVGPREAIERTMLTASRVNWISGKPLSGPTKVTAQIRHHHPQATAVVRPTGPTSASVEFESPQPAISPGQAVVFYDGTAVVGGGWID